MTDEVSRSELKRGARALGDRKAAAIYTWAQFGQRVDFIEALGTRFENTAGGRAILTNAWLGNGDSGTKNIGQRQVKDSRRVLHAAHAYWELVVNALNLTGDDQAQAEAELWTNQKMFRALLKVTEDWRRLLPAIPDLKVSNADLIEFRAI